MSDLPRGGGDITKSAAWARLAGLAEAPDRPTLRALFRADPDRVRRMSVEAAGLYLDFSKNRIGPGEFDALLDLAREAGLVEAMARMFAGEPVNETEGRSVLHVALRDSGAFEGSAAYREAASLAAGVRDRMKDFVGRVHAGTLMGARGDRLDTVVHIGIGGSDLGPQTAVEALRPWWIDGRRTFFVSNVDGQQLSAALAAVDPARTLFIVASKTFTTEETMTNAASARAWFLSSGMKEGDIARHFVALSTNREAVSRFGIAPNATFEFWDWVGGRFSMWSAIGLPIALQVGFGAFERMLKGAAQMDAHFRTAAPARSMPVLLALVGLWNRNFEGAAAHAVLPYDQHLHRLPAYLQQAEMESNGKRARMAGGYVTVPTAPVIFGEPGTNGQHAFHQLLHQGTDVVSADFIAAALSSAPMGDHHEKLLANFVAQTEALMLGRSEAEARAGLAAEGRTPDEIDLLAAHRTFPGNRPTNAILMERLTPETFGALIALYEHKIFCQGLLWGLNAFDQPGVELGKTLAREILPMIAREGEARPAAKDRDASTRALIDRINDFRALAGRP